MRIFSRLFYREKRAEKTFLIVQVVTRHKAWFPAHNRGRDAPLEALAAWERQLQPLSGKELILLITDNHARNRLLGKVWPLTKKKVDEIKEVL
jgi:hypothetical protein